MKTEIRFLEELGHDLAVAARREGRGARPPRPGHRVRIMALAAAGFLAVAGGLGYLLRHGPSAPSYRVASPSFPDAPETSSGQGSLGSRATTVAHGPHSVTFPLGAASTGAPVLAAPSSVPGSTYGGTPGGVPLVGPQIVKTASLGLVVPRHHFGQAFSQAMAVAGRYGGYVAASSSEGHDSRYGELTIRLPTAKFELALADLEAIGKIDSQSVSGQDVTARYVDLAARIRTWQAQENRLLALMQRASTIPEILRVQSQLQGVQLTIEQLKGQLRVLDNRIALASIEVSIRESGVSAGQHVTTGVPKPSITRAFQHAVAGALSVLTAVILGLGYLVPIALLTLLLWLAGRRLLRQRVAA